MKAIRRRIGLKIFLSLLLALFLAAAFFFVRALIHRGGPESFGDYTFSADMPFSLDYFKSESLYLPEGTEDLSVMQIADPQIKLGFMTHDKKTMDLLDRAIAEEQPDICVVTGDLTLSVFTYDAYRYFAEFMEEREQYWTLTFGNHDAEFDCSKYTLATLLDEYEYCLFSAGPENVKGASNFLVNVFVGDKTEPDYSLVMLDSGMYPEDAPGGWVYDWLGEDQVAWYRWAIEGLQALNPEIKTSLFMHIPTVEFAEMYYASCLQNGDTLPERIDASTLLDVTDVYGIVGEEPKDAGEQIDEGYDVGIFYQGKNTGLFDAVRELGSTGGIFVGHDHMNTLRGTYGGIYLSYGLCSGYHTYPYFESPNGITKLLGLSDSAMFNARLWQDKDGSILEKGVTMIDVSLADGALTVANHTDSSYD